MFVFLTLELKRNILYCDVQGIAAVKIGQNIYIGIGYKDLYLEKKDGLMVEVLKWYLEDLDSVSGCSIHFV